MEGECTDEACFIDLTKTFDSFEFSKYGNILQVNSKI